MLGLLTGINICILFLIILILWYYEADITTDDELRDIFPIFRGASLFILYLWLYYWNIYGWQLGHIDFKLILQYKFDQNNLISVTINPQHDSHIHCF